MWYSYRGGVDYRTSLKTSYRIGYAQSEDGISWTRMDECAGIDVSAEGWDSEMIEYPHIIQYRAGNLCFTTAINLVILDSDLPNWPTNKKDDAAPSAEVLLEQRPWRI